MGRLIGRLIGSLLFGRLIGRLLFGSLIGSLLFVKKFSSIEMMAFEITSYSGSPKKSCLRGVNGCRNKES